MNSTNTVHVAGPVDRRDGSQACVRCGEKLTEPGLTPFGEGDLVRLMRCTGYRGIVVELQCNVHEMCGKETA